MGGGGKASRPQGPNYGGAANRSEPFGYPAQRPQGGGPAVNYQQSRPSREWLENYNNTPEMKAAAAAWTPGQTLPAGWKPPVANPSGPQPQQGGAFGNPNAAGPMSFRPMREPGDNPNWYDPQWQAQNNSQPPMSPWEAFNPGSPQGGSSYANFKRGRVPGASYTTDGNMYSTVDSGRPLRPGEQAEGYAGGTQSPMTGNSIMQMLGRLLGRGY